jgi:5'-3' exoribonuclease 2
MDGRMVPVDLDEDAPNGDFDNMYLDMNGIIHPCCHPEDGPAPEDEEHMYENIFLYLDRLIRIIRPRRLLYMAIDGVAPRAKMNQQRARRFRAAQERDEIEREQVKLRQDWEAEGRVLPNRHLTKPFDSNVITPGTTFLHKMSEAIRYFIHDRTTNDPLWQKLKFRALLSDANIPGEGEHKIMDFLRAQRYQSDYDPNTKHCLYGADADLIMLGLATHEAHFTIIREVVMPRAEKKCTLCGGAGHVASECTGDAEEDEAVGSGIQKPFQMISISILRQYLSLQFSELKDRMPESNPYDVERCMDDFVFMCFFVGNDFLPHLPSLSIRDGSIDQMMSLYIEILPTLDNYLSDSGRVHLKEIEQFIEYLGGIEDQVFKNSLEREAKRRAELRAEREREEAAKEQAKEATESGALMGSELAEAPTMPTKTANADSSKASDTNAWHAQLLAQSFSMELDDVSDSAAAAEETPKLPAKPEIAKSGKFIDREFHQALRDRMNARQDLGESMADTVRLGEGPHWKQRYYFEKFKVKQEDLVDFLQRIRKAYVEGLAWVLIYYYQGVPSWTWFYPYHYAPFASDLIGCSNLKCGDKGYFTLGGPFQPFQQLMSVLPPASSAEAGIPKMMRELMIQPFSPIIDFYPADFGLDLNGKRFTYMAVILLPFIDEPRMVRILAPLLKNLTPLEKVRNRYGQAIIFGNKDDKSLFHSIQLAQAAFEAGHTGVKQTIRDGSTFGFIEGWQGGGASRTIVSPIEGLPDVEESHCLSGMFFDPEFVFHSSQLLPGITEAPICINAADMDEQARMKGFGGEPAKRMILQALGKDPDKKPKYAQLNLQANTKKRDAKSMQEDTGHWGDNAFTTEEDNSADTSRPTKRAAAPPSGSKVIKVHATRKNEGPAAPEGYKPVRSGKGNAKGSKGGRNAPF